MRRVRRHNWQSRFPSKEGAWWFYGKIPGETKESLIITMVHKTFSAPPKYFAFWANHFYFKGEIEGKWQKIDIPQIPGKEIVVV